MQHARPIRADAGRTPRRRPSPDGQATPAEPRQQTEQAFDPRRIGVTVLSLVVPGLGQLLNGRPRMAALFFVPTALLVAFAWGLMEFVGPARLAAWAVVPERLSALLNLNLLLAAWRLLAAGQAFFDRRYPPIPGRLGAVGGVIVALVIVAPHIYAAQIGASAGQATARMFAGGTLGLPADANGAGSVAGATNGPVPGPNERINILMIGVDTTRNRTSTLTDTMIVASLDPVGKTISMVSIPRDTVSVPLGNGDVFGPKINSLYGYAQRHPDEFPDGPERALQDALGELLDIPIHYYARVDFRGFMTMIDAVGGIDVTVKHGFSDPDYDGIGIPGRGFSIEAGRQHLTGGEALAYARVRKALGESDFTRAARQQQILVALKNKVTNAGSVFWSLPQLIDAIGETVVTDIPINRLPDVALVIDDMAKDAITRVVIKRPLVRSKTTQFGSSLVPDLDAIKAMADGVFSDPGVPPTPYPPKKVTAPTAG